MTTKILLCCNEGMSTSYLVKKMNEVAKENNLNVEINAINEPALDANAKTADVIMLGPQIAFLESKIRQRITNIPVEAINAEDFGKINAKVVLKRALTLIKNNKQ